MNAFIDDRNRNFTFERDISQQQFAGKTFLISGFQKPGSESLMNLDGRSDYAFGNLVMVNHFATLCSLRLPLRSPR